MASPTYSLSFFSGIFLVLLAFVYATFIVVCRHRRARQLAMDRVWEYGRNTNTMNYNDDNGNDRYYREMMNSVRSFKYTARQAVQECVICLSKVSDGERVKVLPNCMHMFHDGCIDMWLSSHDNCPVCRAPVLVPSGAQTSSASVVPVAS